MRAILLCCATVFLCVSPFAFGQTTPGTDDRIRTELPYRNGMVVLLSDYQDFGEIFRRASGNVEIRFEDLTITADEAQYNLTTGEGQTTGETGFKQQDQWMTCSRAEFNLSEQTGTCYDAKGYTDREFLIEGDTFIKTGRDRYRIYNGSITTCKEENPKWVFTSSRSDIYLNHTARLRNTFLKIKGIPVFYTPYTILPLEKKKRSSGFTTFETGTSTSKGRVFSQGYYQTLGQSADMTLYGDYFTERGLALGGQLRTRPNSSTSLSIDMYGIRDDQGQGGVRLIVDGATRMQGGWNAVAKVNISSSFNFRQAFAENFKTATVAQETADVYLNRNRGSYSTNISFERYEVALPVRSLVTWKVPSLEFVARETPLGNSPILFSLRSSVEGISKRDSRIDTESIVQRMDIHPRIALRLPALLGFSVVPSVGVRETFYGAQMSDDPESGIVNHSLRRSYTDVIVDLKAPFLEKNYGPSRAGAFRHTVEPYATYRWIEGIDEMEQIIRFDENDAVADTNEIEYGIVNRFYTFDRNGSGAAERREFLTIALAQKYYFDPSFGGVFREGHQNSFSPLDSLTGFYQTGIERNFSPLSAAIRIRTKSRMDHDLRVDYDTKLNRWRNASLTTAWQEGRFRLSGTYFRSLETEPGMFSANQIQSAVEYGTPESGFASGIALSYNFKTESLLNSQSRFSYAWNCCSISTEFRQFALGARTETQFSFSFWLKGLGSLGNMRAKDDIF